MAHFNGFYNDPAYLEKFISSVIFTDFTRLSSGHAPVTQLFYNK